jgi:glycosyltransferase involved in cell wall biosynthesis
MMRVLHLVPTLGTGGAERQLYLLCRETNAEVEHLVAVASSEGRWAKPLRELGIPVRCLGSALRDPRLLLRLRAEIKRVEPDVVHCWLPSMNLTGALAAGSRPVIASVRNVDDWKPWFYTLADWIVSPLWNAVISNSHAGAAQLAASTFISPCRISVVPNGIVPRPPQAKPSGAERTILTASRLVAQKRVGRILEAARLLPEFRFRIAGGGPERLVLEAVAPKNVEFLGEIPDVGAEFDNAGWFMLASEREGTSNALLEAMQAGCVPVVMQVGDNPRIVEDGVTGRVVQFTAQLAPSVRESFESWSSLSEAARKSAERYSVPAMAMQTLSVYRSLTHATVAHPLPRLH